MSVVRVFGHYGDKPSPDELSVQDSLSLSCLAMSTRIFQAS